LRGGDVQRIERENFLIAGARMLVQQRAFAEALGAVDHAFDVHASEYQA
jgi:hypothetical protein